MVMQQYQLLEPTQSEELRDVLTHCEQLTTAKISSYRQYLRVGRRNFFDNVTENSQLQHSPHGCELTSKQASKHQKMNGFK